MDNLTQTLEILLQHTEEGDSKRDLIAIFGEYYRRFPGNFSEKFSDVIRKSQKLSKFRQNNPENSENSQNSDATDKSDVLPKINLPSIHKITEMLETSLVLPMLANDLMVYLHSGDDNNVDTKQLAKFIAKEQPIVIRVLRVANSPFYGLSRQVDSLETAIMVLGVRTIRTLVLSVNLINSLQPTTCELFNCDNFWQHSLAVAVASLQIAKLFGDSSELAFTAGLLHDIGRLALADCFHQEYNHVLKYQREQSCTLLQAENLILNINHQQIGKILAKNWRLPESLSSVIYFHHTPSQLDKDAANLRELCDIVHLANIFVALLKLPKTQDDKDLFTTSALDEACWGRLLKKVQPDDILKILPKIEQDFEEISQALLG